MDTLLFFKPSKSSFIQQDEEFLSKRYRVKSFLFPDGNIFKNIVSVACQLLFLIKNTNKSSVLYVWFADYHAFLPLLFAKIFNKKSVLIIGGYDAAKLVEFKYGAHISPFRSWIVKQCCVLTTIIVPVSSFVLKNLVQNIKNAYALKSKIVYNGADTDAFSINYLVEKEGVICISGASTLKRINIKGLDFYAEIAMALPSISFTLVGVNGVAKTFLENLNIPNLKIIEWLDKEALTQQLIKSKVICQFSRYESFGLAVAEGMLCGCIPVTVKNIGPEEIVSEDTGVVIPTLDLDKAKIAIKSALAFPKESGNKARLRVMNYFSLKKREENILDILQSLNIKNK